MVTDSNALDAGCRRQRRRRQRRRPSYVAPVLALVATIPSYSVAAAIRGSRELGACHEGWDSACQDDPFYRSKYGMTCEHHQTLDCEAFVGVGYSEYEAFQLVNACPCSCGIPCGTYTQAPSVSPSPSAAPTGKIYQCTDPTCQDDPSYQSKLSLSCANHARFDCTTMGNIGYDEGEIHELINRCPCSCRTRCGDYTLSPSEAPSDRPTISPSARPSVRPTMHASPMPSSSPSARPSRAPSHSPSTLPSASPSNVPSTSPTARPSTAPSHSPTTSPTSSPSEGPTVSVSPTSRPSLEPSLSLGPSWTPTETVSASPSSKPTLSPTRSPSTLPSASPSDAPSTSPTATPTSR